MSVPCVVFRADFAVEKSNCTNGSTVNSIGSEDDLEMIQLSDVDPHKNGRTNKRLSSSTRNKSSAKSAKKSEANNDENKSQPGRKKPAPHQIKFYTGDELDLMRMSVVQMDLFLLTRNGFPSSSE